MRNLYGIWCDSGIVITEEAVIVEVALWLEWDMAELSVLQEERMRGLNLGVKFEPTG